MVWRFLPEPEPLRLRESPCRRCGAHNHYTVDHDDPNRPMVATLAKIRMLPQCPEPVYKDAA